MVRYGISDGIIIGLLSEDFESTVAHGLRTDNPKYGGDESQWRYCGSIFSVVLFCYILDVKLLGSSHEVGACLHY